MEQHTNLRFAWLRKKSGKTIPPRLRFSHSMNLVFLAYNLVYWIPMILGFTKVIDYSTAFIWFFAILVIRGIANSIRNNVLIPEKGEKFVLRSP